MDWRKRYHLKGWTNIALAVGLEAVWQELTKGEPGDLSRDQLWLAIVHFPKVTAAVLWVGYYVRRIADAVASIIRRCVGE